MISDTQIQNEGREIHRGSITREVTCEQRFERLEIASHVNFQAKLFNGGIIANAQTLSEHIMTYSRYFK